MKVQVSSGGLALLDEDGYAVAIAPSFRSLEENMDYIAELAKRWNATEDTPTT